MAKNGTSASEGNPAKGGPVVFAEATAWRPVGSGWQPLFGSFQGLGFSVEWHDFTNKEELDWSASFHPDCIELCLNLSGEGFVEGGGTRSDIAPLSVAFYRQGEERLIGRRLAGQQHQFLTIEFSRTFLQTHLDALGKKLHPLVRAFVDGKPSPVGPAFPQRLTAAQQQLVEVLRQPPVFAAAQPLWYQCKVLEMALTFFMQVVEEKEQPASRQSRTAQERVEQVIFLLRQDLCEPPSLEELGKKIGCSPFYLSRTFSQVTSQTIPQYLRRLRMEKAAELLQSGEYNVTEAAMEVGYNSPSHFSQAFHETYGCCPGLYPLGARRK
ncbi:MAG TPA: helix-turn-helix domain-containing protein [Verrucomicrobiae bacterium]